MELALVAFDGARRRAGIYGLDANHKEMSRLMLKIQKRASRV
jgi:hypothetical protein